MDAASKELSVLVRHVPRIVVSRFIKKPKRLRGPESSTFTGVVALFGISGSSSLGSKLSDDERSQINSSQTNGHKMRTSLPIGLMERSIREQPGQTQEAGLQHRSELIPFLRGYVPGTISLYLQKGLVLNPCTHNITVVFIKLEGVKEIEDPSEQLEQVQRYLRLIQESAYKVQGTLRQFVIDDKGAVAIIVLGLPPFYHENNGNAFCGSVGSSVRAECAVVGDVINLAARLMASARIGEIFCDEKTRDETKETIEYQDAKELTMKGKQASVKVYTMQHQQQQIQAAGGGDATATRLDAVHALLYGCNSITEQIPFLGTAAAMHRKNIDRRAASGVGDVMAALAHHQEPHRVLIVAGESGTGKTMLLRHLVSRHSRCFMGAGDPVDATMEFHAWCGIVREMTSRTVKMAKPQFGSPDVSFNGSAKDGEDDRERGSEREHRPSSILRTGIESALYGISPLSSAAIGPRMLAPIERTPSDTSMASMGAGSNAAVLQRTHSGSRTMEDPSVAYEHVPVLEHLVHKSRIARSMIPILNDLLPCDHLYQGEFRGFDKGEERTKALEHMIFSIVDALSAYKPILLLFDNAQWMDGMSWSLVLKVLEELPNMHCLIATRSQSRAMRQPLFELIEHLPITKRQELRRFSYQVTSLFLCQRFHITIMDTQALDFVYARTNVNPAEVIKLMEFMLVSKYIATDRNVGSVTILSDLDDLNMQVPRYTRARVMSCVDGLDSLAQLALKVISINLESVEERAVSRTLNWFITSSDRDESTDGGAHLHHDMGALKLKVPESDTGFSIRKQVRMGLAECEKEAIVTINDRRKLFYFNSEEMRLVVYDAMLPSQRETIHSLYCHWYREVTADPLLQSTSGSSPHAMVLPEVTRSATSILSATERVSVMHSKPYQQLVMLGYHLARAGDAKAALEAYQKAAEHAIDMKELAFATDCMQSSFKILEDHYQQRGTHNYHKLDDLDYILLRSRVEFTRGAIAVEKSEWDTAITHTAYVIRLCQRKGSVLCRYSSSVHQDGLFESTAKTSSLTMSIGPSASIGQRRRSSSVLNTATALRHGHDPRESLWYLEMQERCMPRLINFRMFLSWTQRVTAKLVRQSSKLTVCKHQWSNHSILMRMGSNTRIQPEETLQALHQVNFYRRKAEILIKKILLSNLKQEEMSRDIQKLTQKSLQTKQKR